jgi:hypothetical protein
MVLLVKCNWSLSLLWRVSKPVILTILDMSQKLHVDIHCCWPCLLTHITMNKLPHCKTPVEDHQLVWKYSVTFRKHYGNFRKVRCHHWQVYIPTLHTPKSLFIFHLEYSSVHAGRNVTLRIKVGAVPA